MKKKITRIITLILSTLMLFSIGLTTSGCSTWYVSILKPSYDYMIKYMKNIPVEQTGFRISSKDTTGILIENTIGTYNVDGIEVTIETDRTMQGFFILTYNGISKTLNNEFLRNKSQAFYRMQALWYEYNGIYEKDRVFNEGENLVKRVMCYGNTIFFLVSKLFCPVGSYVWTQIPSLFLYDIQTDQVIYLGYDDDYERTDYESQAPMYLFCE